MTQEQNLALSSPPNLEEVPATLDGIPVTEPVVEGEVSQEPVVDNDLITISRKDLDREIARLQREDKDFANVFNRTIGNKAAQRYKPTIDQLTAQNEALTLALRRQEYSALTPEQVNERFKNDPVFAQDYARVVHAPVTPPPAPVDNAAAARQQLNTIMQMGVNAGLTDADVKEIQANIGNGTYDTSESIAESLENLQNDVVRRIRSQSTPTIAKTPVPPAPTRTDTASPDMSNPAGRSTQREQYTNEYLKSLPWEEQFKLIDRLGGMDKAIQDKTIIVPGLNDN